MTLNDSRILVVGAGLMGAGIAQVAAQAGHAVQLYDSRAGAAEAAKAKLAQTLDGLVAKGRLTADAAAATLARITPVDAPAPAELAIEAIVENLDLKRALFAELEALLPPEAVIATNTSSISVTALARGMQKPERLVGMHFFNPVPLMKLVEVVSGLGTAPEVAQAVFDLATRWGKTAVHARSTPGFIVNRIARPYYAEALMLLQDRAAAPELIDACLRAAGFRMGPCELMDLIGHDTNFAVTNSVFAANFFDRRFTPSLVQQELVDAGFLGRKSGRGFYRYPDGAPALPAVNLPRPAAAQIVVHGRGPAAERFAAALPEAVRELDGDWIGLSVDGRQLRLTDGRRAAELARGAAVFDLPLAASGDIAYAGDAATASWLTLLGLTPRAVADVPGLIVARTIAMLINEAADAVQQGVCDEAGADAAMKLGVNYPAGPFEWLARWDRRAVVALLDRLDQHHRGERYRVSPYLK
ncbi:3-hydroxyacyl-CoA dehydrogenase [Pelomonas aquatica]|jgi:3-hydroxybutyryl-CoA dehydrogenase|uniref:3-hydroxyacyl-CoA dehydrogenase n=1 Tax=Pelomonas aquatica TaxID=431058 RepID=A0A9X4LHM4_9BURK|nr:3-hydroxyacyl-CoA dehydrogenase [Pelomonas aquatica]MCY4755848.1 3-hydroxyacyl-CoA dehydrogenase [Pelomonas aquatica]MDG0863179.1 3-hydroxyacyl-CoA dehydrogenase [Pelomonas aquatica]